MDKSKKKIVRSDQFVDLDIEIPEYRKADGSASSNPPFSRTKHRYYKEDRLASGEKGETIRTEFFIATVRNIYRQIGHPVPYAFRDKHGQKWSMDAGCVFAVGKQKRNLAEYTIEDGYVTALTPYDEASSATKEITITTDVERDIVDLISDGRLKATERETLILARVGQGRFRRKVLAKWDEQCAVTGCDITELLRASHILAWKDSSNVQRLDPSNGIPLIANLDALFDKGLISFDDDGKMLIGQDRSDVIATVIGSSTQLRQHPEGEMRRYLADHRHRYGF